MSGRNSCRISCDRNGRPVPPSDVSWQSAVRRAVITLPAGAVLLPAGLVLYGTVTLPESVQGLSFIFGLMIFIGAFLMLCGVAMLVLGLIGRAKAPSESEIMASVKEKGLTAYATVTGIKLRRVRTPEGRAERMQVCAVYDDVSYGIKRRFTSGWKEVRPLKKGDLVEVHYDPESNIEYYMP